MTVELSRSPETDPYRHVAMYEDVTEQDRLLDAADIIAYMEAQFARAPIDSRQHLLEERDRLVNELVKERPGHTILNEVILQASLYESRGLQTTLPEDGSIVRAFGTRDRYGLYLEEVYVLHEKPDGGFHYLVQRVHDGTMVYELDDAAGLSVTRMGNDYIPAYHQPFQLPEGGAGYNTAIHNLLRSSLEATGSFKHRTPRQRAKADSDAQFMLGDCLFAQKFLGASSSREFEARAKSLMDYRIVPLSEEALALIAQPYQ